MTDRIRDNLDELRHIEGFPIGEDEDLHALSDPPHYTAYPNPHIAEFIEKWAADKGDSPLPKSGEGPGVRACAWPLPWASLLYRF